MADVRAFPGIRYAAADRLDRLAAPAYDIIPDEQVASWHERDPHNFARLTRPGDDYEGAARALDAWLDQGILVEDGPAMYVYEVEFDGRRQRDLLAALRLQPYEDGVVLPHERTHRGPKVDRLSLMRATHAALEPLWFLVDSPDARLAEALADVASGPALAEFEFEGARHALWRVLDPAWQGAISALLAEEPLLIADGHHRYETTLGYTEELGGDPESAARFTPALISVIGDPGLEVLPTHRVLVGGVRVTGGEPAASLPETIAAIAGRVAAGHYDGNGFQVLPLEGELAVVELHRQVIDNVLGKRPLEGNVLYTRDAEEAVRWVDEGRGSQAFFLPPPDLREVLRLARSGRTVPQKSTYFHPKPPSGLVLHRLDADRHL